MEEIRRRKESRERRERVEGEENGKRGQVILLTREKRA